MQKQLLPLATAVLLALTSTSAFAQTDRPGEVNVTLYQGNIALVRDIRSLELIRGNQPYLLTGFPQSVMEQSVLVRHPGHTSDVIYRNNAPGYHSLLRSLVGKEVRLDHHQGSSVTGILEHFDGGFALVRRADGTLTLIQRLDDYVISAADLQRSEQVYPQVAFHATPSRSGLQPVVVYYLSGGFQWNTQYTLIVDEQEQSGELSGVAMVQNNTGMVYTDVSLQLMAGSLNLGQGGGRPAPDFIASRMMAMSEMVMDAPDAVAFSEFQRFDILGEHTLIPGETRRVPLVNPVQVTLNKRYRYTSTDRRMELAEGSLVRVMYDLQRAGVSGGAVDRALPGGNVRLFKRDGAYLQIIGEDAIGNTPARGPIRITSAWAFDILVRENPLSMTRISDAIHDQVNEVVITNTKNEDIVVEVDRNLQRNQRITGSSVPAETSVAGQALFRVPVKKGESVTLTFTIRSDRNN